jgi:lipid-binding SYLF domain-containing protein
MKMKKECRNISIALALVTLFAAYPARADNQTKTDAEERLTSATTALHEIAQAPDKGIPDEIFEGAKCVAVVPSMIKGGFILGGVHGRGVTTCRTANGKWSAPAFFSISGGSWGAQIGVEDVQLVMLAMTDEGMRHMLKDKVQIGADASAAAGPVGRHASAGVDWKLDTDMLTYSRARGLFAGIDLAGAVIEHDVDTTTAYYGKELSTQSILDGKVPAPMSARAFLNEVARVKTETSENK